MRRACCASADATHRRFEDREAIAAIAAARRVPFVGIWLDAPIAIIAQRVTVQVGDASNATAATVAMQAGQAARAMTWTHLNAQQSVAALKTLVLDLIGKGLPGKAAVPTGEAR